MTNFAHPHESASDTEVAEKTVLEPKAPWAAQERIRAPWVKVQYGQTVAPPNEQTSNLRLSDDQVMKSRTEPVVNSSAPPLNKGGVSDLPTE